MNKNYWIIPLTVGLDNNLKPLDKLIYAQILSLSKIRDIVMQQITILQN